MPDVNEATASPACVLLAEDDPVSALFMAEAMRGLGLDVESCADGTQALSCARERRYDLLMLDCRLPGHGAREILDALSSETTSASHGVPAIASSAEVTPDMERELRASGFREVLRKPLQVHELEQAVQALLPHAPPLLDETAALDASGDAHTLQALRGLFRKELETLSAQLDALIQERGALNERLHRLRASCGFCGALPLARACEQLSSATPERRDAALEHFRERLAGTLLALQERAPSSD
ncbi:MULTISPECIES: response regulator [Oleiagrimonas]|uniref:Response regulator n=1 Tax=Oleiagrimonas citrea TaxID=1665687 RepID=A0A846ZNR5_9GAMM|nr:MULTISPECIES: response regulator [Oleiagrimonas]NKZ39169.1 response regulator [Oleiagrimonas citrea]RAP57769.1 hypothetical protein BTJ49_07740 [Oleiagrimonas sp. MCCC 1A03011]